LGFTAANNVGYATSRGRTIYFLNPDTELVDELHQSNTANGGDSLWTLYQTLMSNPHLGLVGPQLRFPNNALQSSRYRFQKPIGALFESGVIGRYWRNNPWQRDLNMVAWPATFHQEVDCVVGAAMLARREALEQIRQPDTVGPFDEGFFMYSEEVDLCKRLKLAGWRIAYVPEAVVIHYEGQSSSQVVAARDIYYYQSKIRFHEKYFGQGWAIFLRFVFLLNIWVQLVIEACKWLLGHKRDMRAKRITAYRQLLASRLRPKANTPPAQTVNSSAK
jgi:GT2 family glycosyltransferase